MSGKPSLFYKSILLLLVLALLLPAGAWAAQDTGVVKGGKLNLRQAPSYTAKILAQYPTGTRVEILERGGDWHKVRVDGKTGYMAAKYVVLSDVSSELYGVVRNPSASGKLNLREEPNTSSKVISQYASGVWVQILSRGGSWHKVRTEDGNTGYMSANFVVIDNLTTVTYATVHTANGGTLNLREEPSFSAKVLAAYKPGTQVQVLLDGTDWDRVKAGSKTGYMHTDFLSTGGTSTSQATVTSSGGKVNLREDASYTARVLGQYAPGTKLEILQAYAKNGWHKVRVDGKTGYMDAAFVRLPNRTATVNNPNTGRLNLRDGPSFDDTILKTFKNGTQVEILNYGAAWCYVKVNGLTGYMVTMYLSIPL